MQVPWCLNLSKVTDLTDLAILFPNKAFLLQKGITVPIYSQIFPRDYKRAIQREKGSKEKPLDSVKHDHMLFQA